MRRYQEEKKQLFFHIRVKLKSSKIQNLVGPQKIENKGCFWTDSIDIDEIKRVVNFLTEVSDLEWKKILNNEFDHILKYDKNNEKFINFAKSIKMPIN